jgi:3-polyprenyl-4-hydroxybenzoate decarboxylase
MSMQAIRETPKPAPGPDLEKFRLRHFVARLHEIGEVEVHDEPVALGDLSAVIEATLKAAHFKRAGVEQFEMIAAVSGSRKRLAAAFGVVGRENVIAGTDCGFAQSYNIVRCHPSVQWAKLEALVEGARMASEELWGR